MTAPECRWTGTPPTSSPHTSPERPDRPIKPPEHRLAGSQPPGGRALRPARHAPSPAHPANRASMARSGAGFRVSCGPGVRFIMVLLRALARLVRWALVTPALDPRSPLVDWERAGLDHRGAASASCAAAIA